MNETFRAHGSLGNREVTLEPDLMFSGLLPPYLDPPRLRA